jgi:hypothetical protein
VANVLICEERGKRGCEVQLGSFPFSVTSAYFCAEAAPNRAIAVQGFGGSICSLSGTKDECFFIWTLEKWR